MVLCPCWNLTCILIVGVGEEEVVCNLLIPLVIGATRCVERDFRELVWFYVPTHEAQDTTGPILYGVNVSCKFLL